MIINRMDSKQEEIEQLSSLLKGNITPNQRFLIERELKAVKNRVHSEEDSAYYTVRAYKQGFLCLLITFVFITGYSIWEISFCELLEYTLTFTSRTQKTGQSYTT